MSFSPAELLVDFLLAPVDVTLNPLQFVGVQDRLKRRLLRSGRRWRRLGIGTLIRCFGCNCGAVRCARSWRRFRLLEWRSSLDCLYLGDGTRVDRLQFG